MVCYEWRLSYMKGGLSKSSGSVGGWHRDDSKGGDCELKRKWTSSQRHERNGRGRTAKNHGACLEIYPKGSCKMLYGIARGLKVCEDDIVVVGRSNDHDLSGL